MTHRTSKRRFVWVIPVVLILVVLAALAVNGQAWNKIRTLASLQRIDDYPLYVMRYYGDYGFANHLKRGVSQAQPDDLGLVGQACSTFAALNPIEGICLGRNFDWNRRASLLLFTDPPDGYASVAMVDLQYLGSFDRDPDLAARQALLSAPYLPFDGLNERGVAIGLMLVPCGECPEDPAKVTISDLDAVRLVLDYASHVEEAITLLGEYNIRFSPNGCLHYMVADAAGHSAVIEFWDGEMIVLRNQEDWQAATNFLLSQCPVDLSEQPYYGCARYGKAWETLQQTNGQLTSGEAMHLLQDVSQNSTKWSVVYGLTTGQVRVAMGRNYERVHEFQLKLRPN